MKSSPPLFLIEEDVHFVLVGPGDNRVEMPAALNAQLAEFSRRVTGLVEARRTLDAACDAVDLPAVAHG